MISRIGERGKNHLSLGKAKGRMKLKYKSQTLKNFRSKKTIPLNLENFCKVNKKLSEKMRLLRR